MGPVVTSFVIPLNSPSGAFDYDFGALDNLDNPLTNSYTDLVFSTISSLTYGTMLFINLSRYLPGSFIRHIIGRESDPAGQKVRRNRDHVRRVARELIDQKRQEMAVGQSGKDILSLLGVLHRVALSAAKVDI